MVLKRIRRLPSALRALLGPRPLFFAATAAVHAALILFVAFSVKTAPVERPEPLASVMKLADLSVYVPPKQTVIQNRNSVESVAENMVEADEIPDDSVVEQPLSAGDSPDYLPMHKISVLPVFAEQDIMRDIVYPAIALRSGIEGIVYLELFVDRDGLVRRVTVLKETPPDRGFGDAAAKVFENRRGIPARANGEAVAVRYRYQLRFTIKS
jgi:protein TonB